MQPYQEASEELLRRGERPGQLAKKAGNLGLGAAATYGGAALAGRVLPFLNKFIPNDLAIKGLRKVDPRLGKFIDTALKNGGTFDEAKEFIRNKIEEDDVVQDAKNDNVIWKFSKKLAKFIDDAVGVGHTIDEVEGMARAPGNKFKKDIENIEKSMGLPFKDIIRLIHGGSRSKKGSMQSAVSPSMAVEEDSMPINQSSQQAQTQAQPGQGQQALMAMLQQINQRMAQK